MKLFEAFFLSLISCLIVGAVMFLGLPALFCFCMNDFKLVVSSEFAYIFGVMYAIYAVIQLMLSVVHAIQAYSILQRMDGSSTLSLGAQKDFYMAELILYLIVFVVAVYFFSMALVVAVLIFSIPYLICCTASVGIFLRFLKLTIKG